MKSRGNTGNLIVKNITIKTGTYIFYRRVFTMARFTLPRDLYHGKGALEALKTFKGKKAMICVGGGSMKRFGFLDKAVDKCLPVHRKDFLICEISLRVMSSV